MIAVLPEIGSAVAGLVLLAFAFALFLIRDFLQHTLSKFSVLGYHPLSFLAGWVDDAASAVMHAADSTFDGAVSVFRATSSWATNLIDEVVHTLTWLTVRTADIIRRYVPEVAAQLRTWASNQALSVYHHALVWYHDALAYTDRRVSSAAGDAQALFSRAETDIAREVSTAETLARSLAATAEATAAAGLTQLASTVDARVSWLASTAASDVAAAENLARSLFAVAEHDAAAAVATAEATATVALDGAVKSIYTDLETWGDHAISAVWPDAAGDIESLRRTLGGNFPDIRRYLDALGGLGVAGLSGALVRSIAGTATAVSALDNCVIPNCKNLSQLGKDLAELGGVASTVAMLGYLIAAVTEPVATANDTVRVAAPFLDTVFGPLASLLSAGVEHV